MLIPKTMAIVVATMQVLVLAQCARERPIAPANAVPVKGLGRTIASRTCPVSPSAFPDTDPDIFVIDWWNPLVWRIATGGDQEGLVYRYFGPSAVLGEVWSLRATLQRSQHSFTVNAVGAHPVLVELELAGGLSDERASREVTSVARYMVNGDPTAPHVNKKMLAFVASNWGARMAALGACAEAALKEAQ